MYKVVIVVAKAFSLQRLLTLVLVLSLCLCAFSACQSPLRTPISRETFLLDTIVKITIYQGGGTQEIEDAFALCRRYEELFSRTIPTSDIARLNARTTNQAADETAELLQLGLACAALTNGAVDITIGSVSSLWDFKANPPSLPDPAAITQAVSHVGWQGVTVIGNTVTFANDQTQLDVGAIAKGYIADKLKAFLVDKGVTSAIINLGGNIQCIGQKDWATPFAIGIQRPFSGDIMATAQITDLSMVTSGVYERYFTIGPTRYHHLLDPSTGFPVQNDLLSVTIFCESSATADALSTACFVLGRQAATALIDSLEGVYAIFITNDYQVHTTQNLRSHIPLTLHS